MCGVRACGCVGVGVRAQSFVVCSLTKQIHSDNRCLALFLRFAHAHVIVAMVPCCLPGTISVLLCSCAGVWVEVWLCVSGGGFASGSSGSVWY